MLAWEFIIVLLHAAFCTTYRTNECPIYPITGEEWTMNSFVPTPFDVSVYGVPISSLGVFTSGDLVAIKTGGGGNGFAAYTSFSLDGDVWLSNHVFGDGDPILQKASTDFKCFGAPTDFMPTWVVIGTWDENFNGNDVSRNASFQVVFATDGINSWMRFSYGALDFPAGSDEQVFIGIDVDGNGQPDPDVVFDPYSESPNADQISTASNVGCPGCFYFDLTSSFAHGTSMPCDCPCLHGSCSGACLLSTCTCEAGWTGEFCDQDIDECAEEIHNCDLRYQQCVNIDRSYVCEFLPCELCDLIDPPTLHCKKYGFCFNVSTVLASESCASGGKEKYCKCLANKKETKTKWKCGKVKDTAVCEDAIVVETCGMINCIQSNHKKFCGKGVELCVGTDTNFNVASIFGKKDHKSVTTTCPGI